MIVDMMRNDLGRIARAGSVRVSDLFRVERYPTLWQMTSCVSAETRAAVAEIFAAMFPCASVTGAPKASTMRIIAQTENRAAAGIHGQHRADRAGPPGKVQCRYPHGIESTSSGSRPSTASAAA